MGQEIERKFEVTGDGYRQNSKKVLYRQGYLSSVKERTVRVRIADNIGFITVKGKNEGAVRTEFEYEIPYSDADQMLNYLCEKPIIEKYRYKVNYKGFLWEVDEFLGENQGLVIAEIELTDENASFETPSWIGKEVTGDERYYNSNLLKNPFISW